MVIFYIVSLLFVIFHILYMVLSFPNFIDTLEDKPMDKFLIIMVVLLIIFETIALVYISLNFYIFLGLN